MNYLQWKLKDSGIEQISKVGLKGNGIVIALMTLRERKVRLL